MNIQIFGQAKCFDTQKAQRFFKDRRIPFQFIDLKKKKLSRGELTSIKRNVESIDDLVDFDVSGSEAIEYMAYDKDVEEKLLENPKFLRTPIVRSGGKATIGYEPKVWEEWIRTAK